VHKIEQKQQKMVSNKILELFLGVRRPQYGDGADTAHVVYD